jgi:hypothetical protein
MKVAAIPANNPVNNDFEKGVRYVDVIALSL